MPAVWLRKQPAEPEHNAAFPFLDDVDRIPKPNKPEANYQHYSNKGDFPFFPPELRKLLFRG